MSTDISNCKWNTTVCTDISNCCPKPIACKDGTCGNCCKCCDLQYIKNGVIECEKPNIYNTPYYFQNLENPYYPSNKNNCCHGEFGFQYVKGRCCSSSSVPNPCDFIHSTIDRRNATNAQECSNAGGIWNPNLISFNKRVFVTKNSRGGGLGDISYPRNQSGRWNQSTTNTKLFPVISVGRRNPVLKDCWKNGKCPSRTTSKYQNIQFPLTTVRQSGRLFKNTHPNQSKRQLFSYLARNRAHLKR